ncbi:interferon-inducible GTPase 5-like [Clupea harengus]|uniref:Interferon-inducible GTPase 5-like n=1 Tax=Clupea harengus TaxID=7950 RepID=A0A8M1KCY2_CLUHA|nr:interferon-inducible GTPase 5-like [Clupea harengus]
MLERDLSLPLDRLRVPAHLTSQGAQRETTDQLRDRVSARQQATKQRFDRSHRAKHPAFTIRDWTERGGMHAASAKWPHLPQKTCRPAEIQFRTLVDQLILQHDQSMPITADQQDDVSVLKDSSEQTWERAIAKAREVVDRLDNVTLNIAVTGETGAGKSSFVNAIRGVQDTDEGAAPTDVEECTMKPTMYPHPTMPNVKIWDLPGTGGTKVSYKYQNYDFFIIVSATRFKESEIMLANEIKKNKRKFYFVRTKTDFDVANEERKKVSEEATLQKIRNNCEDNLRILGSPPVFLITSHDLERFDFHKLVNTLKSDLPDHKRYALVMSLPVYSMESLDRKYNTLKDTIWAVAFTSGAISAMMADQQDDLRALLNDYGESTWERAIVKAREEADRLDNVTLNIAVTGNVGSGKSSFINAIRGLQDTDEGAAPTGEVETSMEPTMYPHPTMPNVNFWDLPGVGSSKFKAETYLKDVKYQNYDFFIIVSALRFKDTDMMLANEFKKKKKNFYFVRTMTDNDVTQEERKGVREEQTLQKIRNNCLENLRTLGPPPVFLITSRNPKRFDFQELQKDLERGLPEYKRDALVMSLPVYSKECLEQKYSTFKKVVWAVAITSGAIATATVPHLSLACDVAMVVFFLSKCYYSFGLNDGSRERMSQRVNKSVLAMVREASVVMAIAGKSSLIAKMVARLVAAGVIEALCSRVPVVGTITAAAVSFVTTRSVLLEGVKELYSVAKRVIEMAGLK